MQLETVRQLYQDVEKVLKVNSGKYADEGITRLYNVNLAEAKRTFPNNAIIQAVKEVSDDEDNLTYADLLPRLGQLESAVKIEMYPEEYGGR